MRPSPRGLCHTPYNSPTLTQQISRDVWKRQPQRLGRREGAREREAHIKDLEASDVQDPDEHDVLPLGLVQSLVDVQDQPVEHALIDGLGQSLGGKISLQGHQGWVAVGGR